MDKLQFLSCSCKDDDLIKRSSERGDRIQKSQYYLHATLFLPLTTYGSVQDRYILSVEEQEWIPNCVLKKKRSVPQWFTSVHPCTGAVWRFQQRKNTLFWFILTLYSCGNVIVLVTVHFINNWFMMILVAVYVYLKINAVHNSDTKLNINVLMVLFTKKEKTILLF